MINGEWTTQWYKADSDGRFKRPETQFRADTQTPDFKPSIGRYHLYVANACPWAHRTLIARTMLTLTDAISVSVVHPFMADDGWVFNPDDTGSTVDHINGKNYLHEVYKSAADDYTGRVTVPILWDTQTSTIVNNESKEIVKMLDRDFSELGQTELTLYPADIETQVGEMIEKIYNPINNGVYRCGFATSQLAYEEAAHELFAALDECESLLEQNRYLCGELFSAADIFLFTTLIRFDAVYFTHFKCNLKMIRDYPNLSGLVREIYQMPGVAQTVNMPQIKSHYFGSHETINPHRIVPIGPQISFDTPHGRDHLSGRFGNRS